MFYNLTARKSRRWEFDHTNAYLPNYIFLAMPLKLPELSTTSRRMLRGDHHDLLTDQAKYM